MQKDAYKVRFRVKLSVHIKCKPVQGLTYKHEFVLWSVRYASAAFQSSQMKLDAIFVWAILKF